MTYQLMLSLMLIVMLPINAQQSTWAVVGAGPAGIATIMQLIKNNVSKKNITWIDPQFNGGRLEALSHVPSNTKVSGFLSFFKQCSALCKRDFLSSHAQLKQKTATSWCPLELIHKPLVDVSDHLCKQVTCCTATLTTLSKKKNMWHLGLDTKEIIIAHNVVLATGAQPRVLEYTQPHKVIPLEDAFNQETLQKHIAPNDIIGVFGNSHSAILAIKNIYTLKKPPQKIINFHKTPLRFLHKKNGILYHKYSGLKARVGQWAKKVLVQEKPDNIIQLESNQKNIQTYLPVCTKVIYGVGYQRSPLPVLTDNHDYEYDDTTGIIAPNLYGIGIAFPEKYTDPSGGIDKSVGLLSFMRYAKKVVPLWIKKA